MLFDFIDTKIINYLSAALRFIKVNSKPNDFLHFTKEFFEICSSSILFKKLKNTLYFNLFLIYFCFCFCFWTIIAQEIYSHTNTYYYILL